MGKSLVVKNGNVLTSSGEWLAADILIQDGCVSQITPNLHADDQVDAKGAHVLPGLIDLHTHGVAYESPESDTLDQYAKTMAERGATSFFLTLFAPAERSAENMRRHRKNTQELRRLPQIAGFRLESPYLAKAGGGQTKDVAPITPQTTDLLLQAGGGHLKIWDVSPELAGAPELIRELDKNGIVCSMAHTSCTIEQARTAVDAGMKLVTHLFDTFELPVMKDSGVYPAGLTDYVLVEDRLHCEIIGDGTHVHPLLVELAFRAKTLDRVCFVTDSNFGAGLAPGTYHIPGWGEDAVITDVNNGVRLLHRDMGLAGSALTPIDNFRNLVRLFKKDLAVASRVCSRSPARLMGLNKGEIAPEKDADLILLNADLDLLCTIVAGNVVYRKA